MNIIWALVALLFTIVDTLVDFETFLTLPGDAGYSIAAVWTFLLPVVVGWLQVGSQLEPDHLRDALNDAHEVAYVATASEPVLATGIPNHAARAIDPSTTLIDYVNADERKTAPVFNYSRVFIWSQYAEHILGLYEHAATKAGRKITVRHGGRWMSSDEDNIVAQDRIGNEAEVVQYCTEPGPETNPYPGGGFLPDPTIFRPYSTLPHSPSSYATTFTMGVAHADGFVEGRVPSVSPKYDEETLPTGLRTMGEKPVFATGVFQRVAQAAILAHILQWGTTGASILIQFNTPPTGFGCRVLTFIIYGAAGTLAFWLLLFSSVLAHSARPQSVRGRRSVLKTLIGWVASLTRWSGKAIAIANGLGILVSCTMQFAGVYDNCFCSSTLFGGKSNGLVSFTPADIQRSDVFGYWIGGTVMAFGFSGLYSFAIYVASPMG